MFNIKMKSVFGLSCVIFLIYCQAVYAKPSIIVLGARRCINMWDEGCINGQLPGAGNDDDFLNGGFNPGKRCLGAWDEDCNGPTATEGDENNPGGDVPSGRRFLYELLEKLHRTHQVY